MDAGSHLVCMLPPLPRRSGWAYSSLCFTQPYQPSPKGLSGRPAHCPFRGLLGVHSRYGLHTSAVTVFRDTLNRRLQPFRYLHDCSGCFRLERLPGGTCTHWKSAALSRRTPKADIACPPFTTSNAPDPAVQRGDSRAPPCNLLNQSMNGREGSALAICERIRYRHNQGQKRPTAPYGNPFLPRLPALPRAKGLPARSSVPH